MLTRNSAKICANKSNNWEVNSNKKEERFSNILHSYFAIMNEICSTYKIIINKRWNKNNDIVKYSQKVEGDFGNYIAISAYGKAKYDKHNT